MPRRSRVVRFAAVIASAPMFLLGCAPPESGSGVPEAEPKASQVTVASKQGPTSEPTATNGDTSTAPRDFTSVDAEAAFESIAAKVPTAKLVKVYTEDDDPNKLLGRPSGYTSKIAFSDSRIPKKDVEFADKDALERGGSIEVFPDADGAEARAKYIQEILKSTALGTEYDYVKGPILLRVTGDLSPRKAKEYLAALS